MLSALCVGAGGFIGAVMRYLMGFIPYQGDFPLITFAINFLGAVAIGVIAEVAAVRVGQINSNLVLFIKTGLCGGFTTFSTFSLETLTLIDKGNYGMAGAYACGSVVVCVFGVIIGRAIARAVIGAPAAS